MFVCLFACVYQFNRLKVQAQRKFASISGGSVTKTLPQRLMPTKRVAMIASTNFDSKSHTESLPGEELLAGDAKPPPTAEFLTFLCFRGTSVLPDHLDYIKTTQSSDEAAIKGINATADAASGSSQAVKSESKPIDIKDESSSDVEADEKPATASTTQKYMPFAVRKRADMVTSGPKKPAVQTAKKNSTDLQQKEKKAGTPTDDGEPSKQQKSAKTKQNDGANKMGSAASNDGTNRAKRKLRGNADDSQSDKEMMAAKPTKVARESSAKTPTKNVEPTKIPKANTRNTKSIGAVGSTKASDKSPEDSNQSQMVRTTRQRSYSLPKTGNITTDHYCLSIFVKFVLVALCTICFA